MIASFEGNATMGPAYATRDFMGATVRITRVLTACQWPTTARSNAL